MSVRAGILWLMAVVPAALALLGSSGPLVQQRPERAVSYAKNVAPVIARHCLPCHAEESRNSSELSLDTYALLMKGGEHGTPVVPGNPEESILIQKLRPDPPFGDPMPLKSRRRSTAATQKKMTPEEIDLLKEWIRQGAKGN